jgi:hypothetical protein
MSTWERLCRVGLGSYASLLAASQLLLAQASGEAIPAFSLTKSHGAHWLRSPSGTPFFSLGICCVDQGVPTNKFDSRNPAYVASRFYESPPQWAEATCQRLGQWSFTTIGAWSDYELLRTAPSKLPALTPILHVGSTAGAPWWDMWSDKVVAEMDRVARKLILPLRDDPRLLGYYTDNEMGWWNAILIKMTMEQSPASGQRQRLLTLLRQEYGHDWDRFQNDFDADGASSFADLSAGGRIYLRGGGNGIRVARKFMGILADRYYSLVHGMIRKYDQRALILGDRYQSFFYPEVARASRKWVDIASSNLNAHWNDGSFLRSYLQTLHELTGRPLLVSEIYMSSMENGSGNLNNSANFPVVSTQEERARACANSLRQLAGIPYVVGIDWFQYYDEPPLGRYDGENFNMGLVDVTNRPYDQLLCAIRASDLSHFHRQSGGKRRDARGGIPTAPENPLGQMDPIPALKTWNREEGYLPPQSRQPHGDLYVCWDRKGLYLGLYAIDVVEPDFYRNGEIPEADRMQWSLSVNGRRIALRVGAGRPAAGVPPGVEVRHASGVWHTVRNVTLLQIPADWLSLSPLRPGTRIRISSEVRSHSRAYRINWAGEYRLGGN